MTTLVNDQEAHGRIIALEEHFLSRDVATAWHEPGVDPSSVTATGSADALDEAIYEMGQNRIADMDAQGVDTQVLSLTSPGVQNLAPDRAIPLARSSNDLVAQAIATHPDRFQGFAALPTSAPQAAADELRRAVGELGLSGALVNGRTGTMMLDDPRLEPMWAAAEDLRVPVSLHPQTPAQAVQDIYYRGIDPSLDVALASAAIGWHYETGIHLVRMIFSGLFDRHPDLQIIAGHWGEVVLFFGERPDQVLNEWGLTAKLQRSFLDYLRENVYFTPSGMLSQRYLRWTLDMVGIERLLFAVDYPYIHVGDGGAPKFFAESTLSDDQQAAFAHGNWQRLTDRQAGS